MSLADYLAHPAGRVVTLALMHFLWQGAAIAALLAVAVEVMRVRRASSRYAASLVAMLAMLAAPLATAAWLGSSLLTVPASAEFDGGAWMSAVPIAGSAAEEAGTWLMRVQPLALAAWLAGVALFGGRLLVGAAAALALRRESFAGFDADFHPAWFEDVDLAKRMKDAGLVIRYWPAAVFRHELGSTVPRLGYGPFLQIYYRNLIRYLRKHHGALWALAARVALIPVVKMSCRDCIFMAAAPRAADYRLSSVV